METILITGSNRGIGLALTTELLNEGMTVVALSRRLNRELQQLKDRHGDALFLLNADVNDEPALHQLAAELGSRLEKIDVLVNNAAIMPETGHESILDLDLSLISEAFSSNVLGPIKVIRAFFPLLKKSKHPRILNVSSGLGSIAGRDDFSRYPYAISKAALNMLTRSMAYQFKGMTTVAISPGWVRTEMGGQEASLSPQESALSLARAIRTITPDQNGTFLNREGHPGEYQW